MRALLRGGRCDGWEIEIESPVPEVIKMPDCSVRDFLGITGQHKTMTVKHEIAYWRMDQKKAPKDAYVYCAES